MLEERGGVMTFVGGLVALTVVATGLALVMEKRSESSNRKEDAAKTIEDDRQTMAVLRDELAHANEQWADVSGRARIDEKYKSAKAAVEDCAPLLANLRERHGKLKASVDQQDGDFAKYRQEYVTSVRTAAEDEEVEVLRLKSGKEYSQVVIKRVTPEGMEIRHEFGSARVSSEDLDSKWHERFLWH
ncbi:MAG: hypothetical protein EOP87_03055 [Verrucomicrobiaceae bacterium]|nr:MAG: hypothetical protein EOP87_03055 [Verrucomicrobiaceae bacterium]